MDLLDRYVHAVRGYLPKSLTGAQQDDIVDELAENIRAQMDDREEQLGRPLTTEEQEAILQQHGHPIVAAARYQTNQEARVVFGRQLIGPALFPIYLRTLWIVVGISLGVYAVVLAALAVSGNPISVGSALTTVAMQFAIQFVALTAIFTVAESSLPTMRWSARRLPAIQPAARQRQQTTTPQVPRLESVAEIIAIVVLVGWAKIALDAPSRFFGPAVEGYQLAPVWQQVTLPILLVIAVTVIRAVVNLFRPEWVRLKRVVSVLMDIAGLGIVIYLLRADAWVVLANGNPAPTNVNEFVYFGLLSLSVGSLIAIGMDAWKLIRGERDQRRQQQPQAA